MQNRFTLILTSAGQKLGTGRAEVLTETCDEEEVRQLKVLLKSLAEYRAEKYKTRNSRPVFVRDLDEDEYRKYLQDIDPTTKATARPLRLNQTFLSAMQASRHIGLGYNAVSMALTEAAANGERIATVRGATFQYEDTYHD